tara:strand:- start:60 stop:428 length:369 start_codon:yes stop_codon:yes gene_type:complete
MIRKILILMALVGYVMAGNPDGKPFTLSITTTLIKHNHIDNFYDNNEGTTNILGFFVNNKKGDTYHTLYFKMPVSEMITISGGGYYASTKPVDGDGFTHDRASWMTDIKLTCHIPLYKLWEN